MPSSQGLMPCDTKEPSSCPPTPPLRLLTLHDLPHGDGVSARSLQSLFREQQEYLNYFFTNLDYEQMESFVKACLACTGTIVCTGVGKSGFIAQKICQTLVSTGTKALYLSPTDALHGDIGILTAHDLLVCFSKSGGTDELLRLIPYAKAKGAKIVSVASISGCKMETVCDLSINLPLKRELCPFDLAPVTSTVIQMLFGDTVAIALMQAKHLTRDEYAMNHPAGRIGRRLILRVSDVMLSNGDIPIVSADTVVADALSELSSKGCGCVLIAGADLKLQGVFTDGDLRRALQTMGYSGNLMGTRVGDIMTTSPRTVLLSQKAAQAMDDMETSPKVAVLPVLDDQGRVSGLVTLHGLISAGL
ncbi:hypothetical protein ACKKBG_A13690 [Auxenochlorella protothecoides x Auxenochlorella symbiontica]